jgi:hypothetical protein
MVGEAGRADGTEAGDPIAEALPFYVNGTISEAERREVEAHLPGCAACRALLEDLRSLAEAMRRGGEDLLDHVHAAHLEAYVSGSRPLDRDLGRWIGSHLAACAPCREAADALREDLTVVQGGAGRASPAAPAAARAPRRGIWSSLSRTLLHPVPAAAYLALLVAALAVLAPPGGEAPAPPPAPAGPRAPAVADVLVLSSALRGEGAPPAILRPAAAATPALGLEFPLPEGADPSSSIRITLHDAEGREVWSETTPASRVRSSLEAAGIVLVVLPPALLREGPHRIVVEASHPRRETILDARFDVAPSGS